MTDQEDGIRLCCHLAPYLIGADATRNVAKRRASVRFAAN
jgi:hypothetical protein